MLSRAFHQLPSVQAGQAEIGDQQIEALIAVQVGQRAIRIDRFQHLVAQLLQHLHDEHAHGGLVLHHQHDLPVRRARHLRRLRRCRR